MPGEHRAVRLAAGPGGDDLAAAGVPLHAASGPRDPSQPGAPRRRREHRRRGRAGLGLRARRRFLPRSAATRRRDRRWLRVVSRGCGRSRDPGAPGRHDHRLRPRCGQPTPRPFRRGQRRRLRECRTAADARDRHTGASRAPSVGPFDRDVVGRANGSRTASGPLDRRRLRRLPRGAADQRGRGPTGQGVGVVRRPNPLPRHRPARLHRVPDRARSGRERADSRRTTSRPRDSVIASSRSRSGCPSSTQQQTCASPGPAP